MSFSNSIDCAYVVGFFRIIYINSPVLVSNPITNQTVLQVLGTKADFLNQNNIYEMNSYSRYYASLFTSISKFIISDLTYSLNAIANLNQGSAILSTGVTYTNLNSFTMGLTLNAFVGEQNTEYTYSNNALSVQATAGLSF